MTALSPIRTQLHRVSPSDIDPDAVKVIRRLQQFGYEAFLVGGGVRDLLLGREPKDFDVATSARPSEIRRMFANCRLIGRRFRLAHILFAGGKVIEVATFRAPPQEIEEGEDLLITDDNEFGTPESDAVRRDFTVNALFYDPATEEVIDYCGGLDDLRLRLLRCIGEPTVRFQEDPIRILRAVKFAARLDLSIEREALSALKQERFALAKAAIPRLLEELQRMLWGGAASRSFALLEELGLLDLLLPEVAALKGRASSEAWSRLVGLLKALDRRFAAHDEPHGCLLAALFWPVYEALLAELGSLSPRYHRVIAEMLIGPAAVRYQMPRREVSCLLGVLEGQGRLEGTRASRSARNAVVRTPGFDAQLAFLALRADAGQVSPRLVETWQELADESPRRKPKRR